MMSIFAEANQMSMGRTGTAVKTGQAALQEMLEMMKKGQVISAKVLPFVEQIAKREAAPGIAEASTSSFAEQNRFMNQISEFWKSFSGGGGETGLAFFWKMMQRVGTWFEENGSNLGRHFESLMLHLDTLRLGIYEFAKFFVTGQSNSLTEMAAEYGINLIAMRDAIMKIFEEIGKVFGVGEGDSLKTRIQSFSQRLISILEEVALMIAALGQFINGVKALSQRNWYESFGILIPGSGVHGEAAQAQNGVVNFVKALGRATGEAAGGLGDVVGVTSPNPTDYALRGNNQGGFGDRSVPRGAPSLALPSSTSNTTNNHNIGITIKTEGNKEMLDLFVTPKVVSEVQSEMNRRIMSSLVDAPKN